MENFDLLFQPLKIGSRTMRNRIFMPACETRLSNPDGSSSREMADYYGERAKGGAGMIIIENTFVDTKESRSSLVSSGIYNDHMIASHYYVSEAIHEGGALAIMQISHGGCQQNAGATGHQPVSPSGQMSSFIGRQPRALEHDEIVEIEDCFANAALRAQMAGFDGVEIHCAHGYLLDEFLSPYTNHRTDEYGGSEENRWRMPRNIIRKCREKTGKNFIIGVRISAYEGVKGGLTPEDQARFCKAIEEEVDYINVASGIYETMEQFIIPPNYEPHAINLPFAKVIKNAVTKVPVLTVNSLTPEEGLHAVEDGIVDAVGFGRPMIADPYLATKLKEGRREDIRPCCRGHEGCVSLFFTGCPIRCEVNPQTGREKEYAFKKTENPKNIVVIGGGVAGMEAARYASEVGHKVTLIEKSGELGGHFIEATVSSFKQDHHRVLEWLIRQVNKSGADIRMNTEATPELVQSLKPDVVIVATGSKYIRIPVPGIEKTVSPDDALRGRAEIGQKVVVIGGGLVGAETALELGNQGKQVTIVEMLPGIVMQDEPLSRISLMKHLDAAGVQVLTSAKVTGIADGSVSYEDKDGKVHQINCDTVISATGLRADQTAAAKFSNAAPVVKTIGDADHAGKIFQCFHDAWRAVRSISYED